MLLRRLLFTVWFCVALFGGSPSNFDDVSLAQEAAASSGVKSQSTNNYYIDAFLVIVLFGGALFAVCRSSRRN